MISSLFFVIEIEKAIWILKWRGKAIWRFFSRFFLKYTGESTGKN